MGKTFSIEPQRPRDAGRELPLHWNEGPTIVAGLFLVGFGLLFGLFPIMAASGWPVGRPWCQQWMLFFAAPPTYVISLGTIAMGLNFMLQRMQIQVDASSVWVRQRSLRGRKDWVEPLSAYRGCCAARTSSAGTAT